MSNKILGLRTAVYYVPDLEKAKLWYAKAFQIEPYFDEPFYVGLNIGGYELGLLPEEEPIGEARTNNVEIYWGVENIDSAYSRFLEAGAKEHKAPQNVGGELIVATVLDPWNNAIGLIYNPEFQLQDET